MAWSLESEAHYPRLTRPSFMRRFDATMTHRRGSDVFVSYIPSTLLDAPAAEPPPPKSSEHLLCSFISGRLDRSGRLPYLAELGKHLDLHCYGRMGTRNLPNDRGRESKMAAFGTYKFAIAFENAISEDYVTEKFYDPLLAGSVPVYLGAPNVSSYAPSSNCYINATDFAGPRELAAHLLALDRDDEAYEELLSWRSRALLPEFQRLWRAQEENYVNRLLRLLSDRRQSATPRGNGP